MSTLKTKIDEALVLSFLQEKIDSGISKLEVEAGGEMSQAFGYAENDENYVIRLYKKDDAFLKDKFAHDNYSSAEVPIPKIYKIGVFSDVMYFCIAKRAKGITLDNLSDDLQKKIITKEIEVMHAIHKTSVVGTGYGWWDEKGNGMYNSWKDYILNKKDQIYSNWEEIYKSSFLEKETVEEAYTKISELLAYLPEEKFLIHADLGWSNEVSDGEKITGVLDWGNSCYGDFLYDVAYKHFWSSDSNFLARYLDSLDKRYFNLKNADERILCYLLHIGVGVLGFFAESSQLEKYNVSKKRIQGLLSI